jgi:ABC-type iron transport system FetAB permease component
LKVWSLLCLSPKNGSPTSYVNCPKSLSFFVQISSVPNLLCFLTAFTNTSLMMLCLTVIYHVKCGIVQKCNKSQNRLFPHVQLAGGPSSLNIIAFLVSVHNVSFLAPIVNLIKLSPFGVFEVSNKEG